MFLRKKLNESVQSRLYKAEQVAEKMKEADVIILGAGAGLSTSAGFTYTGERFEKYFSDMEEKYGFLDMYSGGFYDYDSLEEMWAFWSRYIFVNRYMDPPIRIYEDIFDLVKDKDYFVLTTNVDHCFQKAGFAKERLFYTQGDYGLFQCSKPCHQMTYDNEKVVRDMVLDQGYEIQDGKLVLPEGRELKMSVSSELVPRCPKCGAPMSMNLRADSTFVQDAGWNQAADRYSAFLQKNKDKKVLFMEFGVGYNTPGIIKYPFWQYTYYWSDAFYVCLNKGQAHAATEIEDKSICMDDDIVKSVENIRAAIGL